MVCSLVAGLIVLPCPRLERALDGQLRLFEQAGLAEVDTRRDSPDRLLGSMLAPLSLARPDPADPAWAEHLQQQQEKPSAAAFEYEVEEVDQFTGEVGPCCSARTGIVLTGWRLRARRS
jgi:hypothetical protein